MRLLLSQLQSLFGSFQCLSKVNSSNLYYCRISRWQHKTQGRVLSTVLLSKFSRRDTIAASLHRFSRSAPEKPSVFPASSCRHACLSVLSSKPIGIFLVLISNISFLAYLVSAIKCRCVRMYRKIRQRDVNGDIKATWPHNRGIKHVYPVSGYSKVYTYQRN